MKLKITITFFACVLGLSVFAQDWEGIPVPANAGNGYEWELQTDVSDDFNYEFEATAADATIGNKWTNYYHGNWSGPAPTFWKRNHVSVSDGKFQIKTSRIDGDSINIPYNGEVHKVARTYLGCATSTTQVQYPVYIETNVKIMNSVLASDVWLLSSDDTQEIDICEAYGGERWTNAWFSDERLHLSHHVFIRNPFTDWQPSDEGSFYTDGETVWREDYHRIGVHWRDPWHVEYYVDGKLVRVRSGKDQIDPKFHTNSVNPGDVDNDTRTGLSKPMDIILNTEDQTWRAIQGLTPTAEEIANEDNNTFKIDWIRVYKPAKVKASGITVSPGKISTSINQNRQLFAMVSPTDANQAVIWASADNNTVSVDTNGLVKGIAIGEAYVVATSVDGEFKDSCLVTVQSELVEVAVDSIVLSPMFAEVGLNETFQLNATVYPSDANDISVSWDSDNSEIALVDDLGLVTGLTLGTTFITASSSNGMQVSSTINVIENIPGSISVDDRNKYLTTEYVSGDFIDVIINYEAGSGNVVSDDFGGVQCMLREILPEWAGIANDYIFSDATVIGTQNGTATVRIDLTAIPASADLPDGNFYFLFPRFMASDGSEYHVDGLAPITILGDPTPAVNSSVAKTTINVYPNPASNNLNISVSEKGVYNLRVAGVHGVEYINTKISSEHEGNVDISHLPKGYYILFVENESIRSAIKFIKM